MTWRGMIHYIISCQQLKNLMKILTYKVCYMVPAIKIIFFLRLYQNWLNKQIFSAFSIVSISSIRQQSIYFLILMNPKPKQGYQNQQLLSEIAVFKQYSQALQAKNRQLIKQKEDLQTQLRNVRLNFKTTSALNGKYNASDSKQFINVNVRKTSAFQQDDQLRQKYERLLIDYNRLKNKARNTKINYDVYQRQNTNLSKQKYVLEEKVVDLQNQVKTVKSMNNSLLSGNQSFDKSYYANQPNNLNASMSSYQHEIRCLNDKIQELQKVIAMKNQEIFKYKTEIDDKNNEFSKMKADIQTYYQKMTELQNQLNKSKLSNARSYRQFQDNNNSQSILISNLKQTVSDLKQQKIKLQQRNQLLQTRIQILQESNLNLTKELREKSTTTSYYPIVTKLSQTVPTQDHSIQNNINSGYRLTRSIIPNYQNQYNIRANNENPPNYYLGEVQSRFITKKIVDRAPVIVRQNALFNNSNMSVIRNNNNATRYQSSLSNESRRYDSLQRKIQNLAIQNSKLRKVLVSEL